MPSSEDTTDLTASFTIRELEGRKRVLRLRDRALPYRPFELSGSQRNSIDWYNGSPIGTIQVFGAKEEPTTISGSWKDRFLRVENRGSAPAELNEEVSETLSTGEEATGLQSTALVTAADLADAVDGIRRSGSEIEVTWLNKVRRGILERFTQRWNTGHDVEWELSFAWSSQGESLSDVKVIDDTASDIGDVPNRVQAKIDDIVIAGTDVSQQSGDRSASVLQQFDRTALRVADMSDDLVDAVVNLGQVLSTPGEALKRVAGILDGLKLQAQTLESVLQDQADGVALDSGDISSINPFARTFGRVLAVRSGARQRAGACADLGNLCAQQQNQLLNRVTSSVISAFQARDGQDLRQVAQQFYGSTDAWRGLMIYNDLKGSELRAGQIVFVPAQPPDGGC